MRSPRHRSWLLIGGSALLAAACGSDAKEGGTGLTGGTGAASGSSGKGSGGKGSGGTTIVPTTGGSAGSAATSATGGSGGSIATGGSSGSSSGTSGSAGTSMCASDEYEQKTTSALDIYFVFDRTGSMGKDCAYDPSVTTPPVASKACYATYAMSDYLINVSSSVDTRLAFQFMSLAQNDCDGTPYETPLIPLTALPVPSNDAMIRAISDETFKGGLGTHIEGALRGIAAFTAAHQTPGREMIGVLMTDGDPQGCQEDIPSLADIIAKHLSATGIRTFIIGMQGATDQNLETLGRAGGADPHDDQWCGGVNPPCHYWNVGEGSGDGIASALKAIVEQAAPIPCEFAVSGFTPPAGQTLDFGTVNVTLTDSADKATQIGQVPDKASCPTDVPAWYYDKPSAPTAIELCSNACSLVTDATTGSRVSVVVGCEKTVVVPPIR